jgi:FkbM family methyltransferase
MIVQHFNVTTPKTEPPQAEGWEQAWHGYYEMTKCESEQRRVEYAERDSTILAKGEMTEADFERDCLLSVLADIKKTHVNMFELGAGWGRMSLALAGTIDFKVVPIIPTSYRCLAVEAEPTHYHWLQEHFEIQNISGTAVQGAVARKNGSCRFDTGAMPDSCYGQAISPLFSSRKLPSLGGIRNRISGKAIKTPVYTVDHLIKTYEFEHVDIVDIDVQGAEYDVVSGSKESIKNGLIDYWLIGTHHKDYNTSLKRLLSTTYDLIVDIDPGTLANIRNFAPVQCHDGIQLYKRKGL